MVQMLDHYVRFTPYFVLSGPPFGPLSTLRAAGSPIGVEVFEFRLVEVFVETVGVVGHRSVFLAGGLRNAELALVLLDNHQLSDTELSAFDRLGRFDRFGNSRNFRFDEEGFQVSDIVAHLPDFNEEDNAQYPEGERKNCGQNHCMKVLLELDGYAVQTIPEGDGVVDFFLIAD